MNFLNVKKLKNNRAAKAVAEQLGSVFVCLLLSLCCVPAFEGSPRLWFQIGISFLFPTVLCLAGTLLRVPKRLFGGGLFWFTAVLLLRTLYVQMKLQLSARADGKPFSGWIFQFYYDKPMIVCILFTVVIFCFGFYGILSKKAQKDDMKVFYSRVEIAFLCFYSAMLIYFFVLLRLNTSVNQPNNFTPFASILFYMREKENMMYEVFMMFFGNVCVLMPAGVYAVCKMKKTSGICATVFVVVFPIVCSSLIELSQLILNNGSCDIDDIMLNCLGFYVGAAITALLDLFARKATGDETRRFFCA